MNNVRRLTLDGVEYVLVLPQVHALTERIMVRLRDLTADMGDLLEELEESTTSERTPKALPNQDRRSKLGSKADAKPRPKAGKHGIPQAQRMIEAKALDRALTDRGVSNTKLASELGANPTQVASWRRGREPIPRARRRTLNKMFGLQLPVDDDGPSQPVSESEPMAARADLLDVNPGGALEDDEEAGEITVAGVILTPVDPHAAVEPSPELVRQGQIIREAMSRLRLSVAAVARELGASPSSITNWRCGITRVAMRYRNDLEQVLGITLDGQGGHPSLQSPNPWQGPPPAQLDTDDDDDNDDHEADSDDEALVDDETAPISVDRRTRTRGRKQNMPEDDRAPVRDADDRARARLACRIRTRCELDGRSQEEIAAAIGISPATLRGWQDNRFPVAPALRDRLAEVLQIDLGQQVAA
jgi:ribosome-binding protein aMBF1 (putative translation factor)